MQVFAAWSIQNTREIESQKDQSPPAVNEIGMNVRARSRNMTTVS